MFKIVVNDQYTFEIDQQGEKPDINGQPVDFDMLRITDGSFHIIKNNRSYKADIVKADFNEKSFTIRVNGTDYTLVVKDRYDILLQQMGMANMASSKVKDIKAPMPGLVLNIRVKPGQELKKGDPVIVLEAMKMENVLKSPGEGKVKAIKVEQGQAVEKNQVLIELE